MSALSAQAEEMIDTWTKKQLDAAEAVKNAADSLEAATSFRVEGETFP